MSEQRIDYQNFLVDTKDYKNQPYLIDFYRWVIMRFQCEGSALEIDYKYYGLKQGKLIFANSVVDNLQVVNLGSWLHFGSGIFKEGQRVIDNKGDIWTIKHWDTTYLHYIVSDGKSPNSSIWAREEKDLMPL